MDATGSRELLGRGYEMMVTIRRFEETAAREGRAGRMPGFMHLYAGQEAVAAGVGAHLEVSDWIASTHRGHGHCIAKGLDLGAMMAELFARETGICRGKGGSMHMADFHRGMLGANGIVGAGLPLAVGAALTAKLKGNGQVAIAFFGDGATTIGAFHESVNLAAVWQLPIVFVDENNHYAEATPIEYYTRARPVAERAALYGLPAERVDGQDFFAVSAAASAAIVRARAGDGPSLIECDTYRYFGHFVGDAEGYRTREEVDAARARDCIHRFRERVLAEGSMSEAQLQAIDTRVQAAIAAAIRFAETSPSPLAAEVLEDVYVNEEGVR